MTRSQIVALVCALFGLALGLFIANWQFTELHVQRGAYILYGTVGFIVGFMAGGWLYTGTALRAVKS
jgi:uncharacterized protein YneF (UPF0154 family)